MSLTNKLIVGGILGVGAFTAVSYFKNLQRAQAQLLVIPTAAIHKLSLSGLSIRVNALLKNPTGASFRIKYPFITLSHNNQLLGSSQSVGKNISIPSYGQVLIKDIMVDIPAIGFMTIVFDIAKALMNNQPIKFTVDTITTLDLGWKQEAFEHRKDLILKK